MPNKTLTVDQVIGQLETTAPRIADLTAGLNPMQLRVPSDGDWSANDVLAHLRACADVWGGCMISILEGAPALRAVNPSPGSKRPTIGRWTSLGRSVPLPDSGLSSSTL